MHHCLRLRKHQSIYHLNILRKTGVCTNSVQSVLCPFAALSTRLCLKHHYCVIFAFRVWNQREGTKRDYRSKAMAFP